MQNEIHPYLLLGKYIMPFRAGLVMTCFVVFLSAASTACSDQSTSDSSDASVSDGPTRLATAWVNAWNTGDSTAMTSLFSPDGVYEDEAFQGRFTGLSGVANWVLLTKKSIPDSLIEVQDVFGTADRVAVRSLFSGTDTGAFAPQLPPTGKKFSVPASTIMVVEGGKLKRVTDYYNLADVLRQVGLPAGAYTPPSASPQ